MPSNIVQCERNKTLVSKIGTGNYSTEEVQYLEGCRCLLCLRCLTNYHSIQGNYASAAIIASETLENTIKQERPVNARFTAYLNAITALRMVAYLGNKLLDMAYLHTCHLFEAFNKSPFELPPELKNSHNTITLLANDHNLSLEKRAHLYLLLAQAKFFPEDRDWNEKGIQGLIILFKQNQVSHQIVHFLLECYKNRDIYTVETRLSLISLFPTLPIQELCSYTTPLVFEQSPQQIFQLVNAEFGNKNIELVIYWATMAHRERSQLAAAQAADATLGQAPTKPSDQLPPEWQTRRFLQLGCPLNSDQLKFMDAVDELSKNTASAIKTLQSLGPNNPFAELLLADLQLNGIGMTKNAIEAIRKLENLASKLDKIIWPLPRRMMIHMLAQVTKGNFSDEEKIKATEATIKILIMEAKLTPTDQSRQECLNKAFEVCEEAAKIYDFQGRYNGPAVIQLCQLVAEIVPASQSQKLYDFYLARIKHVDCKRNAWVKEKLHAQLASTLESRGYRYHASKHYRNAAEYGSTEVFPDLVRCSAQGWHIAGGGASDFSLAKQYFEAYRSVTLGLYQIELEKDPSYLDKVTEDFIKILDLSINDQDLNKEVFQAFGQFIQEAQGIIANNFNQNSFELFQKIVKLTQSEHDLVVDMKVAEQR